MFLDPWGNRIQVADDARIPFTKVPNLAAGMGVGLPEDDEALRERAQRGTSP